MNAQDYLKQYKRILDKIKKKKELAKEYERLASSSRIVAMSFCEPRS